MNSTILLFRHHADYTGALTVLSIDTAREVERRITAAFGPGSHALTTTALNHITATRARYQREGSVAFRSNHPERLRQQHLALEQQFKAELAAILTDTNRVITAQRLLDRFRAGHFSAPQAPSPRPARQVQSPPPSAVWIWALKVMASLVGGFWVVTACVWVWEHYGTVRFTEFPSVTLLYCLNLLDRLYCVSQP